MTFILKGNVYGFLTLVECSMLYLLVMKSGKYRTFVAHFQKKKQKKKQKKTVTSTVNLFTPFQKLIKYLLYSNGTYQTIFLVSGFTGRTICQRI